MYLLFVIACMVVLDTLGLDLPLMVVIINLFCKVECDKIKDGQKKLGNVETCNSLSFE